MVTSACYNLRDTLACISGIPMVSKWLYQVCLIKHKGSYLTELIVKHIIRPQCCTSQILEDMTEIYIIGPTITLQYRKNVGLRNKRGCFF